MELRG